MKTLIGLGLTALTFALLGFTGTSDFEVAMVEEAAYCARVADGSHSDYLQISEVCHDRH